MSSFSSVVHKPGRKIVPKAVPRRNVQRKATSSSIPTPVAEDAVQIQENQRDTPASRSTPTGSDVPGIPEPVHIQDEQDNEQTIGQQGTVVEPAINVENPPPPPEARLLAQATSPPRVTITEPRAQSGTHTEVTSDFLEQEDSTTSHDVPTRADSASTPRGEKRQLSDIDGSTPDLVQHDSSQPERLTPTQQPPTPPTLPSGRPAAPQRSNKRRKTTPRAAPMLALAQSTPAVSVPQPSTRPTPRRSQSASRDNQNQTSSELITSATQRAASISELARSIESQTRALQPQPSQNTADDTNGEHEDLGLGASGTQASRPKRKRQRTTVEKQVAEIVANAVGKRKYKARDRASTPEDAENYELEPTKVTMGELCDDKRVGKKSALEMEMQANWPEILQRRKEDRERAKANAEKRRRKGYDIAGGIEPPRDPVVALAPSMTIVNGVIVVDQASREIDRDAQLQATAAQDIDNVREDKDYYRYVNSGTVGMKPGRGSHFRWDPLSNERFFKGLRMFGTDFLMIANMFPGLSRKQIKTKFIREENADKARVLECLRNREAVELEDYAEMASMDTSEFQTLDSIQKELEEQERQLREEDNERRRREGFISTNEGGTQIHQSVEGGGEAGADTEDGDEDRESNRFESAARAIVEAAVAPKKRQRKATSTGINKRGVKNSRRSEAGVEEVLGNIDEVAV